MTSRPGHLKRLFVSDLDGTLLLPSRELGPRSRDTLERLIAAGGLFTVATGRSAASALSVMRGFRPRLPLIVHNGALTVGLDPDAVCRVAPLDGEVGARLFVRAMAWEMTPVAYALDMGADASPLAPPLFHGDNPNEPTRRYLDSVRPIHPLRQDDGRRLGRLPVLSMMLLDRPERIQAFFAAECDPLPGVTAYPGLSAYSPALGVGEVTSSAASKADAAGALAREALGRGLDAVVAFGDNVNDLSLLLAAKEAYCPPTAPPDVLRQIPGRIGPPAEEGVARHLEAVLAARGRSRPASW